MSMDFDEYDYLEKAVELSELHTASTTANCKGSKKEDEDGHKHNDRTRKFRVSSDEAADRRPGNDRHKHDDRSKKTRVSDYSKDRSGRDQSEREWKKERERPSHHRIHDRERWKFNNRDSERGAKDWNVRDREQERMGSWHNGGGQDRGSRERFYGRNRDLGNFEARVREREERHSDKEVEKEVRLTHGDKELGGSRYSREKKERKEDAASTEQEVDPERDQRTVFAFQISLKADERDVYDFFSRAGKVRDVRLIMDRNLRRSKGVGYVEFYDAMSVPMAIAMTGQLLLGQPVMVKPSEAEKNLVQSTAGATGAGGAVGPFNAVARRLYVGNLHYNITDAQLKQVFEPFGPVELVQLPMDSETGQSKGYAFIQFARLEDAQCAQVSLNGTLELAGRVIKVLAVTDQMHMQEPGVVSGELDDDEGGGLSLTARSRTLLMQKLDRSGTVTSITGSNTAPVAATLGLLPGAPTAVTNSVPEPSVLGSTPGMVGMSNAGLAASAAAASIGTPTECLLLQNMFDPSTETDVDFDLDIKDEVESECSKFGAVRHIYVDKISAGHVYLRFEHLSAASGAQRALHGSCFSGKMITVTFLTVQEYEKKFPDGK